ncbi:MAG: response regulator [bacterium]
MSKGKILVADDEEEIVKSVSLRLISNGYDVVTARDGIHAVTVAVKEKPDVIILDVCMPAGDGHLVAKHLKDLISTCEIPIIFLTARTDEEDFQKAYLEGVSKYITKPFNPNELMAAVSELIVTACK